MKISVEGLSMLSEELQQCVPRPIRILNREGAWISFCPDHTDE